MSFLLTLLSFSELDQFGDTILFTTDDDILEAMSRYDETFLSEGEGRESLTNEEELQRPRTADGEGEERPFTQAGFREEDLAVSTGCYRSLHRDFFKHSLSIATLALTSSTEHWIIITL